MARRDRSRYFTLAHQYVSIAVYNGDLPRLDGSIACADCGQPAQEYDHRDYKKPLDVSPVCRVCNGLRGPGLHADPLETARKPPTRLARYWAEEERKARALKSRPDVFGPAPSSEPAKTEGAQMALRDYTQELIALYRQGETLRSIGKRYGITGERVRQLLKEHGVTGKHGGRHSLAVARAAARDAETQRRKDARALRTFGCTHAEAVAANDGRKFNDPSPLAYAFVRKRINAYRDNKSVVWTLTLPEFCAAWAASGLPRGLNSHSGAVVLKDKSLGYVVGNVVVVPFGDFVSRMRACERQEGRGRWQSSSISS